jgi:hypothetical protein
MALDDNEIRDRVNNDPEFVNIKRYNYSIENLLARYQDSSIPDRVVAQALALTEQELEDEFARLVEKLRNKMGVN